MGQRLYRDMFPDKLKAVYRRVRRLRGDRPLTLRITSDEPWIPWELVKPFEQLPETNELIDDPFLCEGFFVTRWLAGLAPPQFLDVTRLGMVAPPSDLPHVARECEHLRELAGKTSQAETLPTFHELGALKRQLKKGDTQLWHFACHGNFASHDPDASEMILGTDALRSEDIIGPLQVGIGKARPLAMLNACHSGHGGFALTGLGGWAKRFLDAGASAFIGSQWEAHDALAADFAIALYEALLTGTPLAEAVYTARQRIKAIDPTNSTWLTYVVYGDPLLQVRMAGQDQRPSFVPTTVFEASASFVVGKPVGNPRDFFGRGREIGRLFKLLSRPPMQNAAIVGPKRSGKTSLLRYLRDINFTPPGELRPGQSAAGLPGGETYRWVVADFQDPRLGTRQGFLHHVLAELKSPYTEKVDLDTFLDLVVELLSSPTVILLDEVGVAMERYSDELDDRFWEAMRYLASSHKGRNLAFIVAAHHSPFELARASGFGSPFFNVFAFTATLGPLTDDEARELVQSSPIPFPSEDVDWILEKSGRWPILLQILCSERLYALEQKDTTESWKELGLTQMTQHSHLLEG
ncbi:MAG: CHAT domain-containing protein [Actinomycetota bacterium]